MHISGYWKRVDDNTEKTESVNTKLETLCAEKGFSQKMKERILSMREQLRDDPFTLKAIDGIGIIKKASADRGYRKR